MNVLLELSPGAKPAAQAIELEEAVLGAAMLERGALVQISDFLDRDHFYLEQNAVIYDAIGELHRDGVTPDPMTVVDRLKGNGTLEKAGGVAYVAKIYTRVASSANIQSHARIIVQKFMIRSYVALGHRLAAIDETNDIFEIQEAVNAAVGKVNSITANGDPLNAATLIAEMVDNRAQPLQIALGLGGELDACVSMGPGNVCVIGARPAVGKTAVALTTARNVAMSGNHVAFISLEMSAVQLTARLMSTLTGIDSNRITRNDLDDSDRERMARAAAMHGAWINRIVIDDRATLKGAECFGLFARLKKKHKCEVVIVDYLQLAEGEGQHETAKMSNLSKSMKQAAKASGVRLIELSQLKRGTSDTKPTMSDLRESGQIEADGDVIILLSREKGSSELHVDVAKHKFGPVGAFIVHYDLSTQTIGAAVQAPAFDTRIPAAALRSFTEPRKDDEDVPAPF